MSSEFNASRIKTVYYDDRKREKIVLESYCSDNKDAGACDAEPAECCCTGCADNDCCACCNCSVEPPKAASKPPRRSATDVQLLRSTPAASSQGVRSEDDSNIHQHYVERICNVCYAHYSIPKSLMAEAFLLPCGHTIANYVQKNVIKLEPTGQVARRLPAQTAAPLSAPVAQPTSAPAISPVQPAYSVPLVQPQPFGAFAAPPMALRYVPAAAPAYYAVGSQPLQYQPVVQQAQPLNYVAAAPHSYVGAVPSFVPQAGYAQQPLAFCPEPRGALPMVARMSKSARKGITGYVKLQVPDVGPVDVPFTVTQNGESKRR